MTDFEEAIAAAESLAPDDRLRLIARLWETLPADHWAAPDSQEMAAINRRLGNLGTRPAPAYPPSFYERYLAKAAPGGPTLYSAPRRFDLTTIFAVTAAYSLLFTGLTLLDAPPTAMLTIGAFITIVGMGQPLLQDQMNPRAASVVVGAGANTLISVIMWWLSGEASLGLLLLLVVFNGMIFGAFAGYLAGALVGGVFLVADLLRSKLDSKDVQDVLSDMDEV